MSKNCTIAWILILYITFVQLPFEDGYPQSGTFKFKPSQHIEGLSDPVVLSVHMDTRGFLWIGTMAGLYRYDGYNFLLFKHLQGDTTSLSENSVEKILCEDDQGNLWISTSRQGMLNRFNLKTQKCQRYSLETIQSDRGRWVSYAYPDNHGKIWFALAEGGVYRFDPISEEFSLYYPDTAFIQSKSNKISSLIEDQYGTLYVFTDDQNFTFDVNSKQFAPFQPYDPAGQFREAFVMTTVEDSSGVFWLRTTRGLFRYRCETNEMRHFPFPKGRAAPGGDEYISFMDPNQTDDNSKLWIKDRKGFLLFNKSTGEFTPFDLDDSDPYKNFTHLTYDYCQDRTASLWIGTDFLGLISLKLMANPFRRFMLPSQTESIWTHNATSFMQDRNGHLWVGTYLGGLFQFDKNLELIGRYADDPDNPDDKNHNFHLIYALYEDKDGMIWAGSWSNGLNMIDPSSGMILHCLEIPAHVGRTKISRISAILEDGQGILWVGMRGGLYCLNKQYPHDTTFQRVDEVPVRNSTVRDLEVDSQGALWVASERGGLHRVVRNPDGSIHCVTFRNNPNDSTSLSSNSVFSLYLQDDSSLWVGTNAGLDLCNLSNGLFTHYTEQNGFDAGMVYDIAGDEKGNLWVSTEKGLMRYRPTVGKGYLSRHFNQRDGLPSDNIFPYKIYQDRDGNIYCGGRRNSELGFFMFCPDSLYDNDQTPPVVITQFNIKNQEYDYDTTITEISHVELKYNQNFFSFEFAALDFNDPERNQYAYILEGFDEEWVYSGTRNFASYTAVPPGNYTFRVRGSNNDGFWNETGCSLSITILTPPWKTGWAYTGYIMVLVALSYFLVHYYLRRQRLLHELELEHLQSEKLTELDRMKSRFFANVSHEFRTPLTLILGPLEKLQKMVSEETRKDLDMIRRNARRLQLLINQLLSLSRLESGKMQLHAKEVDLTKLVREYVQSFESLSKTRGIELSFTSDDVDTLAYVDREKLETVLNNLLSNAFKFTEKGGKIGIALLLTRSSRENEELNGDWVAIRVADTGRGIPDEKLQRIFDRFYQAGESWKKDQEGTGIGLALAKELVELHHGRITVESRVGEGTTFTVFLPNGTAHLEQDEIMKDDPREKEVVTHNFISDAVDMGSPDELPGGSTDESDEKPLLLIVDDNADLRSYIRSCVIEDYSVIEAINGEKGLAAAIERIPNLVVSDVMMPEMDGMQFCRKLKADERTSHIPVILLTARASMEDKLQGLETGADDFLTKPFDPQELLVRVRNLLTQRELLREHYLREFDLGNVSNERIILSMDEKFIVKAKNVVEESMADVGFDVEAFAGAMALSRSQLHRKLKALLDQSATEFIRTLRLHKAAQMLAGKAATVAEVAYDVGFNNPSYFAECFKKQFGKLPSEYLG